MSDEPKKYGLKLPQKSSSTAPLPVPSVFGDGSDSDNEINKERDADKKFHMKYGSNKARDKKAVADALADDPDVYEYDSLYDKMQSKRNAKTEEQKAADAERAPKYAHKIVLATQKRQMEQLMVEERKQAKEREAEGDEFKDKDAFVTGAYKKQIEERERIRRELEEQDRMDSRLKVEDQSFWQANFNRKLLDDLSDVKPNGKEEEEAKVKEAVMKEESPEPQQQDSKLFRKELRPGLNKPTSTAKPKRSPTPERRSSRRDRDRDDHHRKRRRSTSRDRRRSTSRDRSRRRRRHDSSDSSPSPRSKENNSKERRQEKTAKPKTDKEILYERLEKVKEILKQRNTESDIFMAKQRYLQRKKNGEIRAPIF